MIPETFDEDYYAILGVRRTATAAQIKQAFRSKAKLLHPDRNRSAGATDAFVRLGEAYRVLRDEEQRLVFDAFRATAAPPRMHRRPVWRAAAVMVALLVSIGAASTFGYLALRGGPPAAVVADSMPAKPAPAAATTGHLLPLAGEGGPTKSGRVRDDAAAGTLAVAALVPASLIRPPPSANPLSSVGSAVAPSEDDEILAARLSDPVDAPFAVPQPVAAAKAPPHEDARVSDAAANRTRKATATALPSQRVDHRLVQPAGVAPKPVAIPAAAAPVTLQKPVVRPIVRAYAKPSYPVRVVRPYRVAAYPPYPRAYIRRPAVRRSQAPRWAARPAPADDWPF